MANFLEELNQALNSVVDLVRNKSCELRNDIDDQKQVIQGAYDNIKQDISDLAEISFIVNNFACDMEDVSMGVDDNTNEGDAILYEMRGLVDSGFIIDEDYVDEEDFEDDVEMDIEDDEDCDYECCECENPCNYEE